MEPIPGKSHLHWLLKAFCNVTSGIGNIVSLSSGVWCLYWVESREEGERYFLLAAAEELKDMIHFWFVLFYSSSVSGLEGRVAAILQLVFVCVCMLIDLNCVDACIIQARTHSVDELIGWLVAWLQKDMQKEIKRAWGLNNSHLYACFGLVWEDVF